MKIIKFFFPGIYAKITGVTNIPGNAKLEIIIKILQAKVVRLESAKRALQAAEGISASYDAIMTTWGIISTGLGLFISNKIIGQHGGTIEVESIPGEGTRMGIKIPKMQTDCRKPSSGRLPLPRSSVH